MAQIDDSVYDLSTADGQRDALIEIINESNSQFDKSTNLVTYQVAAYTELTIDLVQGGPSGLFTSTYVHGLGFPPVVIAFGEIDNGGSNIYNPLQYLEKKGGIFSTFPQANTYQYWTVDNRNLYFNVVAVSSGGFYSTTHFQGAFYIMNIPAQV